MKLSEHDHIVTAYAESASGPGWGNSPIWVIIRSSLDGSFRQDCIQPSEQTAEMQHLYHVLQAAHLAMTGAVRRALEKRTR